MNSQIFFKRERLNPNILYSIIQMFNKWIFGYYFLKNILV